MSLKGPPMKIQVFDRSKYMQRQIIEALTCPINRHFTRLKHGCDDWGLWRNPSLLINHFIENGGAVEFAKRRADFLREVDVPDEIEFYI